MEAMDISKTNQILLDSIQAVMMCLSSYTGLQNGLFDAYWLSVLHHQIVLIQSVFLPYLKQLMATVQPSKPI